MGRRGKQRPTGPGPMDDMKWEGERTMAAAEAESAALAKGESVSDTACLCGGDEFVLEAFLHVVGGKARPEPIEVGTLTCPECSREYEAIVGEGGAILRGEFRGFAELDED